MLHIDKSRFSKFLFRLTLGYLIVVIPGILVYFGVRILTDLRGKELFNAILPIGLILMIIYLYALIRPVRLTGYSFSEPADKEKDTHLSTHSRQDLKSDTNH